MSTRPPFNSAPNYGQPPCKSRAGLIITLIVALTLVALTAIGLVAYRLISDYRTSDRQPGSASPAVQTVRSTPR